ncbi:MAG: DNA-3-methyladenine glycosylase I [Ornithinimicrobium sp.]
MAPADAEPPDVDVVVGPDGRLRCPWAGSADRSDPDYLDYHDREWGREVHGEQPLLERLCLEAFQSGLSWLTILRKREDFRRAFARFDPDVVAAYTERDVETLMQDASIVRNRRKIEATIGNARATVGLRRAGGLETLFWSARPPLHRRPVRLDDVPPKTDESAALAASLKAAGFAHLGPTTVYAAMQACGVVDDHLQGCFRAVPTPLT